MKLSTAYAELAQMVDDDYRRPQRVESGCGAVAVGRACLLPPLSSGGALVARPWLRFHTPLIGRVEDWRAGLGRSLFPLLARPFVCECPSISAVPRFQPPPRRTQRADFPHCAPPFASPQGLWDLACWGSFQPVAAHSIAVEQPERVVQPRPTPLLPAEAPSFPSLRQMAPDLLFHPVFDVAEALAGVPQGEVVHHPRSTGLIRLITRSTGCDRYRRNTCLSSRSSAVRFFSLGVYCGRIAPRKLRR
jgi:hypothetical protein